MKVRANTPKGAAVVLAAGSDGENIHQTDKDVNTPGKKYMVRESHDRDYRLNRRYRDAVKAFGYDMSGDELLLDDPAGEYEALARMPEPSGSGLKARVGTRATEA